MVLNLDGENYYDTIVNTEIDNYLNSVIVDVLNYEYEPAEAMSRISQWKNIRIICEMQIVPEPWETTLSMLIENPTLYCYNFRIIGM